MGKIFSLMCKRKLKCLNLVFISFQLNLKSYGLCLSGDFLPVLLFESPHYENTPMRYTDFFQLEKKMKKKFQWNNFDIFAHILWEDIRTALARRF